MSRSGSVVREAVPWVLVLLGTGSVATQVNNRHYIGELASPASGAFVSGVQRRQSSQTALSGETVKEHVRNLAHDSLQGRLPGTSGGDRAADYIATRFRAAGLRPGSSEGGYLQAVPLLATRVMHDRIRATLHTSRSDELLPTAGLHVRSGIRQPDFRIEGDVVFAGYGIQAPISGRTDFAGSMISGSWVAILHGLPDAVAARLPGGQNSYYGEDAAKLQTAHRHGALGVLFLTDPADSARFQQLRRSDAIIPFIQAAWGDAKLPPVMAWAGPGVVEPLASAAGTSYTDLVELAGRSDFSATPLDISLELEFSQSVRQFTAPNVVGRLAGADPMAEAVVVAAHYDALGIGPRDETGDSIYNGAVDNAIGTAAMIQLAATLSRRRDGPSRTVVFLATTAEEADYDQIGARYYAEHPSVPLQRTAVVLNLDGINWRAPTLDFRLFPVVGTDVGPILARIAEPLGLVLGTASWQHGLHFSFDTKEFLAHGIVGLTLWQGSQYQVPESDTVPERLRRGAAIHQPADEYHDDWSEDAIEQHLDLYYAVLEHYADGGRAPQLVSGNPFEPLQALTTKAK